MMSMVERVARAMQAVDDDLGGVIELSDGEARALAVAAIEAMSEPTDAMVRANGTSPVAAGQRWLNEDARQTWQAMIDAALNEHL